MVGYSPDQSSDSQENTLLADRDHVIWLKAPQEPGERISNEIIASANLIHYHFFFICDAFTDKCCLTT